MRITMEFKISYLQFWDKVGSNLEFSFDKMICYGATYLEEQPELKELGLKITSGYISIFTFQVIDEQKFFLAKIKYGI